jgi:hypothetical protein
MHIVLDSSINPGLFCNGNLQCFAFSGPGLVGTGPRLSACWWFVLFGPVLCKHKEFFTIDECVW